MKVTESIRENTAEQAEIFSTLADPTRLKLVKLLCHQHDPDALCVNALAGLLGVTQSAISQHLRVLKSVGLVKGERRGYHVHYYINPEGIKRFQSFLSSALEMPETCPEGEEPYKDYCPPDKRT
ncbi:MAG: metalloregulator ArsR/SmtB family transcription factor [Chloroflexota bacterium]